MKRIKAVGIIAVILAVLLSACSNKDSKNNMSYSISDFNINSEDFGGTGNQNGNRDTNEDTQYDNQDTGEDSQVSDKKSKSGNNSSGKENRNSASVVNKNKNKKSSGSQAEYNRWTTDYSEAEEGFTPMSIPSRKNAYKLSNTYKKIKNGETVNVIYFGGSVTGGTGASDESKKSYSALTTAYLKTLSSKINEKNLSIGGTGTYLGAARFEHDVISANPDLLIIEFAINDVYSGITADQSKANLEYMIRTLHDKNPYADIIIALITNKSNYGEQYKAYKAHAAVANYYNIPIVDLGGEMYNRLKGEYDGFQSKDSVHPNDTGHKLYSEIMIDALKELFVDNARTSHSIPSKRLCKNGFTSLTNTVAVNIPKDKKWSLYSWFNNTDYEKVGSPLRSSAILKAVYPKYLAPDDVGNTLSFTFTGNSFGFIGTVKEGASINFVIDSNKEKTISGTSNTGRIEYPVFDNLSNTSHTVKITSAGSNRNMTIASLVTTK